MKNLIFTDINTKRQSSKLIAQYMHRTISAPSTHTNLNRFNYQATPASHLQKLLEKILKQHPLVDINKVERGSTAFHIVCKFGLRDVCNFFLTDCSELDVTTPDEDGNTPLHYECYHGYWGLVLQLMKISNTTHLLAKNHEGMTPVHLACLNNQANVAKLLLDEVPWNVAGTQVEEKQKFFCSLIPVIQSARVAKIVTAYIDLKIVFNEYFDEFKCWL